MARLSTSLPSVRILVLGDSGVGKTSLLLSLASPAAPLASSLAATSLASVRSTIGCTPHTLLLPSVAFVELFDVGGHKKYALSRSTFYRDVDGLLLVFDCSNTKSYTHLSRWIAELVQHNSAANGTSNSTNSHVPHQSHYSHTHDNDDQRLAASAALSSLPVLAVGTKSDLMDSKAGRLFDSMRDFGLDMVMVSANSGGDSTLHALLPFFHRTLERKAEQTAMGHSGKTNHHSRLTHSNVLTNSHTATAMHHRKTASTAHRPHNTAYSNGHTHTHTHGEYDTDERDRGWDSSGAADRYEVERLEQEPEEEDGGLTIDMNQLDMLSAYNAGNKTARGGTGVGSASASSSRFLSPSSSLFSSDSSTSTASPPSSRTLSSPSSARHASPLSRLLPSGLFGLGGKKEDKQARSRV